MRIEGKKQEEEKEEALWMRQTDHLRSLCCVPRDVGCVL